MHASFPHHVTPPVLSRNAARVALTQADSYHSNPYAGHALTLSKAEQAQFKRRLALLAKIFDYSRLTGKSLVSNTPEVSELEPRYYAAVVLAPKVSGTPKLSRTQDQTLLPVDVMRHPSTVLDTGLIPESRGDLQKTVQAIETRWPGLMATLRSAGVRICLANHIQCHGSVTYETSGHIAVRPFKIVPAHPVRVSENGNAVSLVLSPEAQFYFPEFHSGLASRINQTFGLPDKKYTGGGRLMSESIAGFREAVNADMAMMGPTEKARWTDKVDTPATRDAVFRQVMAGLLAGHPRPSSVFPKTAVVLTRVLEALACPLPPEPSWLDRIRDLIKVIKDLKLGS
ncbi:MAG: hypothetical protein K2X01_03775 [Cyanobacteria bacterium]|nr:hypothetical protein [Cyanobacteriota bacterium]